MRATIIGEARCALAAGPALAETCRGGPGEVHLVRVEAGPAPLVLAMHWSGRPDVVRAVAVRCLRHNGAVSGTGRRGHSGR